MDLNCDITTQSGGLSAVQLCKRLTDKGFRTDDFSLSSFAKFQQQRLENHLSDGIVIGVVCGGTIKAVINGRRYDLRRNNMFLLREDSQVDSFKYSKACVGYVFTFSRRFLASIDVSVRHLISARLMFRLSPYLDVTSYDTMRMHSITMALFETLEGRTYIYEEKIISSLFSAFFYTFASLLNGSQRDDISLQKNSRAEQLVRQFMVLLDQKCCEERSVDYYASAIGITPKYLSLICKSQMGQSASKIIEDVVIRKAKDLLGQSGVSINQVAEQLNFVSQSFFGKYFKQRVGMSPSRYKSQMF